MIDLVFDSDILRKIGFYRGDYVDVPTTFVYEEDKDDDTPYYFIPIPKEI